MQQSFSSGETLLFIGDSITDCGRRRPLGSGAGLGDGYVSMVDSILAAGVPETPIRILNTGISGDRVTDLQARWQQDALAHNPDWLSVKIGINDVCRMCDPLDVMDQVTLERYESVYRSLLKETRPGLTGLILMSPYLIDSNRDDPVRQMMDEYGRVVSKLAGEFDAVFVDVQAAFDRYLSHRSIASLCDDRVHPNRIGHMIIARAFLAALNL